MSLPAGVDSVTLTAGANGLTNPDGTAAAGTVTLTPSVERVTSSTHGLIVLGPVNATLSASGTFTLGPVLATDAADFTPTGWTYRVDENFTGQPPRSYSISLPAAAATVALTTLTPVVSSTGVSIGAETAGTAAAAVAAHTAATDPHGDRAYTDTVAAGKVTKAASSTDNAVARFDGTTGALLQDSGVTVSDTGGLTVAGATTFNDGVDLNGHTHVHDVLVGLAAASTTDVIAARISTDAARRLAITAGGTVEWGDGVTAPDTVLYRSGANTLATDDDFVIQGTGKAYRFRRGGSSLDLEATGADLLVSNWSGTAFDGTQRSYLRLSADAQNVQIAGNVEFVDALYGTSIHAISPSGVAALGAKNSLGNIRFCGQRSTTGAPTTGTWATNDLIVDSAGTWYLCATGGTPGAWTTSPSVLNLPSEQNLLAWTYDPDMAGHVTAQSAAGVGGRITLTRIILRESITWSNIWIGLAGVDAGASLANCYLGVYDSAGTLVGSTADVSASLSSGAVAKALPLVTPFAAAAGTYFVAMLLNGTWTTNSFTFKCSGAGSSTNAGLSAPNLRYSNMLTGQTSLPASLTLASQTTTVISSGWASQWYGVS